MIYAEDDCLNTTTSSSSNKSARNSLTIDVNSLYAIVDSGEDADEGDAILVYSSASLNEGTYALYKGGEIEGSETNGYYTQVNKYAKGTVQGYSSTTTNKEFKVSGISNQFSGIADYSGTDANGETTTETSTNSLNSLLSNKTVLGVSAGVIVAIIALILTILVNIKNRKNKKSSQNIEKENK